MNASSNTLRRARIAGFAIALLVAIASCFGLAASFLKPSIGLFELYRIASFTRTAGFWFLGGYLISGFAFLGAAPKCADVKIPSWESRGLKIVCAICFLIIVFSPHTYVYPEVRGWVTKTKVGAFSISSDVAREYLWRAVRMWSAIPLCPSLAALAFLRRFAHNAVPISR